MNDSQKQTPDQGAFPAQLSETMMQRPAIGTALITLAYLLSIAMQLVAEPVAVYLDRIQMAVGLLLVVVLPVFIKYTRHRARLKASCPQSDGFMAETFSLTFFAQVRDISGDDDNFKEAVGA